MGLCMSCKSGKRKKTDGNEGEVGTEGRVATQGNGMPSPLKGVKIHPPRHPNGSPLTTKNGGPTSFPNNSEYSPEEVPDAGINENVANLQQIDVQDGKTPESGDVTFYDNLNQKQQSSEIEKQTKSSTDIVNKKQINGEVGHRNLKINGVAPQNVEKLEQFADGHTPSMDKNVGNEMEIDTVQVQEEINKISYEPSHDGTDHNSDIETKVGKNLRSLISVNHDHDLGKGEIKFVDENENEEDYHRSSLRTHKTTEADAPGAFRVEAPSKPGFEISRSEKVDLDVENLRCPAEKTGPCGGSIFESSYNGGLKPQITDSLSYAGDPTAPYSTNSTIGTKYKVGTGTTFGVALPTGQSESSIRKEVTPSAAVGDLSHRNMRAPYSTNNVKDARLKFENNTFVGTAKVDKGPERASINETAPSVITLDDSNENKTSSHPNTAAIRKRFFETGNSENRNGDLLSASDKIKSEDMKYRGHNNQNAPMFAPGNSTNCTIPTGGHNTDVAGIKLNKENPVIDFRVKDFASKVEMFNNGNNGSNFVRGVCRNEIFPGKDENRDSEVNNNSQNPTTGNFRTSITLTTRSKQHAGTQNQCDHSESIPKFENQNQNRSTGSNANAWNNSLFLGDKQKQYPARSKVLPLSDQSFQDRFKIDNYEELQKRHETIGSNLKSGSQFPVSVSDRKQPNSNWSERVASEARDVGAKHDEKVPIGGIYHESFHRAIDRNATRPGPISTTNQNIQLPDRHTFRQQVLEAHNKHRTRHGAPPLRLSDTLNQQAQIWADKGAKAGQLERQPDDPNNPHFGENLWSVTASGPTPISGDYPVQTWYEEGVFYDYKRPVYSGTNHFTQLLWKSSQELGVGVAISTDERHAYVVCNYTPSGNTGGGYRENVLPLI